MQNMHYEVTYLTVNGNFAIKFLSKLEADAFAAKVKAMKASGVKVEKVAA